MSQGRNGHMAAEPRDSTRLSAVHDRHSPRRIETHVEVDTEPEHPARIRLTRPEYYCDPSLEELARSTIGGVCRIDAGLTVGRLGYGSVFWRGPFELRDVDLDEIVHFRHKEVTVYPDEERKPPVGEGLNRQAEVSLERIWPIDKQTRDTIKDPDELARMNFRERLERSCVKMDAVFKDYQPSSGTWTFEVAHFSKYSFIEDDDDDHPSPEQLKLAQVQRKTLSLVQRARPPLSERIGNATMSLDVGLAGIRPYRETKRELIAEDDEGMDADGGSANIFALGGMSVAAKKPKFEDLLDESKHLLRSVPTTIGKVEEMKPTVDERQIVEVFKGIRIGDKSIFSLASNPRHMEALFRRGCYVRFNKDSSVLFDANAYSSVVGFSQVKAAPRLEEYIISHLKAKGQLADWEKFKRLAVLRWDPPSLLLRLVDSFVRQILQNRPRAEADEWVSRLCEALFQPFGKCQGFEQKKAVLKWLRAYLSSESQHSVIPQKKSHDDSTNYRVYKELVNGRTDAAVGQAKRAGMFHLATLAQAAVRSPLVPAMRQPMINQVVKGKDVYERKIHLLLSGDVESDDIERVAPAVEGLNWLQTLNVIIGHWARQSVGLDRCVDRLDALIHRGFVKID